jgi:magnesium transporter
LLALPDEAGVGDPAMHRNGPRILPGTGQEMMASMAQHHGVAAVPVADSVGRLVGVVGPARLTTVLRREHVEDLHRLAGITREADHACEAIEEPPTRRARHRLPWLIVGLGGSMVSTLVVARFESALAAKPALAFFVPGWSIWPMPSGHRAKPSPCAARRSAMSAWPGSSAVSCAPAC